MQTINHTELMKLGFPEHTARDIIRQAKLIAVRQFEESRALSNNVVELSNGDLLNSTTLFSSYVYCRRITRL